MIEENGYILSDAEVTGEMDWQNYCSGFHSDPVNGKNQKPILREIRRTMRTAKDSSTGIV